MDMGAEYVTAILLQFTMAFMWQCFIPCIRVTSRNSHVFTRGRENSRYFAKPNFLLKLAYLCDTFDKPNAFNLSLQGNNMHILKLLEKVVLFRKKLQLWIRKINEDGGQHCFLELHKCVVCNKVVVSQDLLSLFKEHLSKLSDWFAKYFEEDNVKKFAWIQDPFHAQAPPEFTLQEEESLIELSCNNSLKTKFTSDLVEFWISIKNEYPTLSSKAVRILIPFARTYLCKAGFSAIAVIESKCCSKIDVEQEMSSNVKPYSTF
ncbi:zinc finger BED domain-containing protein 5-like [Centruroides vittatus]|uniref:zinc finger BED domain-containing protein 5-like n=1 Tax=Centruroides vittatus TaxID=120091 RepID=UPI00350EDC56